MKLGHWSKVSDLKISHFLTRFENLSLCCVACSFCRQLKTLIPWVASAGVIALFSGSTKTNGQAFGSEQEHVTAFGGNPLCVANTLALSTISQVIISRGIFEKYNITNNYRNQVDTELGINFSIGYNHFRC